MNKGHSVVDQITGTYSAFHDAIIFQIKQSKCVRKCVTIALNSVKIINKKFCLSLSETLVLMNKEMV